MKTLRKHWKWHFPIWLACMFTGFYLMFDEHILGNENKVVTLLNWFLSRLN